MCVRICMFERGSGLHAKLYTAERERDLSWLPQHPSGKTNLELSILLRTLTRIHTHTHTHSHVHSAKLMGERGGSV